MSFGLILENNAGHTLIDEYSRQVQIVKEVDEIVPGSYKSYQWWHSDFVQPFVPHHSPAMGIILPRQDEYGKQVIFARINNPNNNTTVFNRSFMTTRGAVKTELKMRSGTTGLNNKQAFFEYEGPVVGGMPDYNQSGNTYYHNGELSYWAGVNCGFDPRTFHGTWDSYPCRDDEMLWYTQFEAQAYTPTTPSYQWFNHYDRYLQANVDLDIPSSQISDCKGYELRATTAAVNMFGYTSSIVSQLSNQTTFTISPKVSQVQVGWKIGSVAGGMQQITGVSQQATTTTITVANPVSTTGANAPVNLVPPMEIVNIETTGTAGRYKITFDDLSLIHTRPADNTMFEQLQDVLYFCRHPNAPWETWSNRQTAPSGFDAKAYGIMPRVASAANNTTNITLDDVTDVEVGAKVYALDLNQAGNNQGLYGRDMTYQGNRTVTAVNTSTKVVTVNSAMTLSAGQGFLTKLDYGFNISVKVGVWTEEAEESSGYGLEVFNSNGNLVWSSNRKNFIVEHIAGSNQCTATPNSDGRFGRTRDNTTPLTVELDAANIDDYYVMLTSIGPHAKYCEGNGYHDAKWQLCAFPAPSSNAVGIFNPQSGYRNHAAAYCGAWTFNWPGASTLYLDQVLYSLADTTQDYPIIIPSSLGAIKADSSKLGICFSAQPLCATQRPYDTWPGAATGSAATYAIGQDHQADNLMHFLVVGQLK